MSYSAERGSLDTGTGGFKCHAFSRCAFETEILGNENVIHVMKLGLWPPMFPEG
jgi:hypothetical protein